MFFHFSMGNRKPGSLAINDASKMGAGVDNQRDSVLVLGMVL